MIAGKKVCPYGKSGSMNNLSKIAKHPDNGLRRLWRNLSPYIPNDRFYLSVMYFLSHGSLMDWKNPKTFNQKLNWLKLWSKDKGFEKYVDKYEVRNHVREAIGDEYLIPLLGVWDSVDDIDFAKLPKDYVLKNTHDSGGVVIVKDGMITDEGLKKLKDHQKKNYFWNGREYPYLKAKPRIVAEQYMVDESGWDLKDYKFFCFDGKPEILFLASERFKTKGGKAKFDYFDMNLNHLPFHSKGHEQNLENLHPQVPNFELMKELAAKLSKGFPFIRVDFYNINGKVYFGELTFFHDDATVPLKPKKWNRILGDMIRLPR